MKQPFRYHLIEWLFALQDVINAWMVRLDRCHICGEPAEYWCENCDRRHCFDHESHAFQDVNYCDQCRAAWTPEELAEYEAEARKLFEEEQKEA